VEIQGHAPVKYIELTPEKAKDIFNKHVLNGQIVQDYALGIGSEKTDVS
jgi:(2Fe-2S) ferredoxin